MAEKTPRELFLELAKPDENGVSRWVMSTEFVGEYSGLFTRNGGNWYRASSSLGREYIILTDKTLTPGIRTDAIKLNGRREQVRGSEAIREDIKNEIRKKRCVILGTSSPVPDHKNGRKNDERVLNLRTQNIDDFQPLSTTANYAKRQHCKSCSETGNRYDAKNLGYPISFTKGGVEYANDLGCIGCFWYDPVDFRKHLKKIDKSIVHKIINILS